MPREFRLPDLGEGLTEAEVVRWYVAVGDVVTRDQNVVEVETAKALVEVPVPYAGTVLSLNAAEGASLAVGAVLLTVGEPGELGGRSLERSEGAAEEPEPESGEAESEEAESDEAEAASGNVLIGYGTSGATAGTRRRRPRERGETGSPTPPELPEPQVLRVVSPLVRRLAADHGVDLRSVTPSGPKGLIRKADVLAAVEARGGEPAAAPSRTPSKPAPSAAGERIALSGFRKSVAAALTRSRQEIPEATVWVEVDATPLMNLRTSLPSGPGLIAYVARFVTAALTAYPVFNARLDGDEIVLLPQVNLGLAVQTERGLLVPAVLNAGAMTTRQLDGAIRELTGRTLAGGATQEELSGGTFTLNNYGSFRVDGSAAIIPPPQVAMLGLGRIIDKPWVVDGALTVRKVTTLSFVFDHRVADGGEASGFMRMVADAIENPAGALADL